MKETIPNHYGLACFGEPSFLPNMYSLYSLFLIHFLLFFSENCLLAMLRHDFSNNSILSEFT